MIYVVQVAKGAQADTSAAKWFDSDFCSTLDLARAAIAEKFSAKALAEDRGDDFANEWERLVVAAETADVGQVLAFDEYAARICGDAE